MKKFIVITLFLSLTFSFMYAEKNITKSNNSTFKVESVKKSGDSQDTGIKVEWKGKTYSVYKGSRGGLYIIRVSKDGKEYHQSLKSLSPELEKEIKATLK